MKQTSATASPLRRFGLRLLFISALAWPALTTAASEELPESLEAIEAALQDAFEEKHSDYQYRLALVEHIYQLSKKKLLKNQDLVHKAQYVEAIAYMRLGDFDRAERITASLCPTISWVDNADIRFRCDALAAALLLIAGNRAQSLAAFDALFGQDTTNVSTDSLTRAKVSYAAVLNENGRAGEAVDLYEELLVDALERRDDAIGLYASNNLVIILATQQDYLAARKTLDETLAFRERNPTSFATVSLRILDLDVTRALGDVDGAIEGLKNFIDNKVDETPLMLGSAHRYLANAYKDKASYDLALQHAALAAELLKDQAHELNDVFVTTADVYVRQGEYGMALEQLTRVDMTKESVPARRANVYRLKLNAILGLSPDVEAMQAFEDFYESDQERDTLASTTRSRFFETRLAAAQSQFELQQANDRAMQQTLKAAEERRNGRLLFVGACVMSLILFFVLYWFMRIREERRRYAHESELNRTLEDQVREKTRELTQNLRTQAAMERKLERKKRVEEAGKLASNMAHDFNNLLQVIGLSNQHIRSSAPLDTDASKILALSDQSVDHGSQILKQLLSYSRQQDLTPSPLDFSRYLLDNTELLELATGDEILLSIHDHSAGAVISVDPAQLTTALLNLISNSVDAMPSGGKIDIKANICSRDDASWASIAASGTCLLISIIDNGIGMTQKQVDNALEPYFTTKDEHSGTGLGLSSVDGFVKQSGGDLQIQSEKDQGTQIDMIFPISRELARSTDQPHANKRATQSLSGERILLVEDNKAVHGIFSMMLRNLGMKVLHAESGREAMQMLSSDGFNFDFVLSDVRMPGGVDGYQLAAWIQDHAPDVGVLLMSGFIDQANDDWDGTILQKPFNGDELEQALMKLRTDEAVYQ